MYCADCEQIEEYFFETTTFWLFLPTTGSSAKFASYCKSSAFVAIQQNEHCITVDIKTSELKHFLMGLAGSLEKQELANTKVTTTAGGALDVDAMGRVVSAQVLLSRYQSRWIVDAIEQQRYTSWFQPIVHATHSKSNPKIFAHEALFRMRDDDDNIMPPSFVFGLAGSSDLLFTLDLVARRSAAECAANASLPGKVFINFNPSSVYDPSYCLRTTASAIAELGMQPSDIVFEITETHQVKDINLLKGILAFYRNAGFGVALDDIGSGWSGLNLLHDVRPDYIKVDMALIRNIDTDHFKQSIVTHLIALAKSNGIRVISEGIEKPEEAAWLTEAGTDFMQGYLFGKPAEAKR